MNIVSANEARALIASRLVGPDVDHTMGCIALHEHQRDAVTRIARMLEQHRGALLADDVGLGKTFVALALARDARDPLVIGPAAVRDAWLNAAARAMVRVRFESVETLARGGHAGESPDLVVVDEAHHLRTSTTKRFAAACAICARSRVLLLSATPVQNHPRDLRVILSLFLGTRAYALSEDDLAQFIVRRMEHDLADVSSLALPALEAPEWLGPVHDEDCLERLLALPPAVPPVDGEDGGALVIYTLVRLWASSRGALRAGLRRRLARSLAMEDAIASGRMPSRAELAAWCFADGSQQLAFPELIVQTAAGDRTRLLEQVRRHACDVRSVLAWLETSPDPDAHRATLLRELMRHRHGERLVAFSEFADTIAVLYRALATHARVAMLTHGGGRVAGGPVSRAELLARFAPGATRRTPERDRIDLLLTTDVLSEGVNLQDASVVVHVDLAWNPARLEQRVGRLRRIGASRESIGVFMFAPPAPAERMLQLERRLRVKIAAAARSMGVAGAVLPGLIGTISSQSTSAQWERIANVVRAWRTGHDIGLSTPIAAAVRSVRCGALACIREGGVLSLVAITDAGISRSPSMIEDLVREAAGEGVEPDMSALRTMQQRVERWLRRRSVADVIDLPALVVATSRRALLHRVDAISRRAPRHARAHLASLVRAARVAATARLSAGAERMLDGLALAPMEDEAWLHAVGELTAAHATGPAATDELLALVMLQQE